MLTCIVCGAAFERKPGPGRNPHYCGAECRRAGRANPPGYVPPGYVPPSRRARCADCGKSIGISPTSAETPRCKECRPRWTLARRSRECAYCGEAFESRRRARSRGGDWIRCCSKSCARKLEMAQGRTLAIVAANRARMLDPSLTPEQRKAVKEERSRRARRARLAGVEREPYTTAEIAERDGYRCWLCGGAVDMGLKFPHRESASVDHVVPLSLGGDDTRPNVRLAHLGENVSRGNRVDYVQPLLVG